VTAQGDTEKAIQLSNKISFVVHLEMSAQGALRRTAGAVFRSLIKQKKLSGRRSSDVSSCAHAA
jgi:hypothetical protein